MNKCPVDKQRLVITNLVKGIATKKVLNLDDVRIILKEIVPEYSIRQALLDFDQKYKENLANILSKNFGYSFSEQVTEEASATKHYVINIKRNNNLVGDFRSPEVSDLFHTLRIQQNYFEKEVNRMFVNALFIGDESTKTYIKNTAELNNSIKNLKNNLFKTMVDYLITIGMLNDKFYNENGVFIRNIYDRNGKLNTSVYNDYKKVIKILEEIFFENGETVNTFSGKKIPKLRSTNVTINNQTTSIDVLWNTYNAAVVMVNFDDIMDKYFGNIIEIDYNAFNHFEEDKKEPFKYKRKNNSKSTAYFKEDSHESESVESIADQLSSRIVSIIPELNRDGKSTGNYLEMKDLYSLSSFIKEFELLNIHKLIENNKKAKSSDEVWKSFSSNPKEVINWYLNSIILADSKNYEGDYAIFDTFKGRIGIIKSLKSFITSIQEKEANSENNSIVEIISHIINNSFGAKYAYYNPVKNKMDYLEMHSHNADRVNLQNSIYAHLLKLSKQLNKFTYFYKVAEVDGKSVRTYSIPKSGTEQQQELNLIKEEIKTPKDVANFIKNILGLYVGEDAAVYLYNKWGEEVHKNLRIILNAIRESDSENSNLLDAIIENESKIGEQEFDVAAEKSEIISKLTKTAVLQDILDSYLYNHNAKPITTVKTLTGEMLPTFKVANLTYNDTELILSRMKIEQEEEELGSSTYKNYFTNNVGLLGTVTKLETRNKGINKGAFEWTVGESFIANFNYDFINPFFKDSEHNGINVALGNYSDKNTILAKSISTDAMISIDGISKYIIGNKYAGKKSGNTLSITELLDTFRKQMYNYYSSALQSVFEDYKKLGVDISGDINKDIKTVNNFLKPLSQGQFLELVRLKRATDKSINITNELHFSSYNIDDNNSRLALNQIIVDYYNIFKNQSNFKEFVNKQETLLIEKLQKEFKSNTLFNSTQLEKMTDENLDNVMIALNVSKEEYKKYIGTEKGEKVHFIKGKDDKLNPLLKRWMWVNAFFREEYLNMSFKGEYMHPAKKVLYRGDNDLNLDEFVKESEKRLIMMAKRNVVFTSTFETPVRNINKGVPENLNIAIIKDTVDELYTIAGKTKDQDLHDGSSIIPYIFSRMVESSYPGKGYSGTKKQFGTFITKYGGAIKKDAETVITNDKIRNSANSIIKFKNKQKQALDYIKITDLPIEVKNKKFNISFIKNGLLNKVSQYSIENIDGQLVLSYIYKNSEGAQEANIPITSLYDIWEAFGGEYSVNSNGDFDESSNELLYDLVTSAKVNDNYILKDKFLHIISNQSAFKAGSTNLNISTHWETADELGYFTVENRFYGPQLSAAHEADESEVREVTQVISALAQNEHTSEIAKEVYEGIASIINTQMLKYKKYINLDTQNFKALSIFLSNRFFNQLKHSDNVSLAKTLLESFNQGELIPFSNQNFFQQFVRDMITAMNNEFITRYYSGMGAVLNPSHNIIQVYEDSNGNVFTQEDIAKEAFKVGITGTNEEIINNYINITFKNKVVLLNEIKPEDSIVVYDLEGNILETKSLNSIKTYYQFKEFYKDKLVRFEKILNIPRNLKPTEKSFVVNGIFKHLFDLDSVRLKYVFQSIGKDIISKEDLDTLTNFAAHFKLDIKNLEHHSLINKKLLQWTNRTLQLLEINRTMRPVNSTTNFNDIFGDDNFKYTFSDVKDMYLNITDVITNYKHSDAELISPNIYKSTFRVGNASIAEIIAKKADFFKEKISPEFENIDDNYDLKINLKENSNPIYIKFVDFNTTSVPVDNRIKISESIENNLSKLGKYRVGDNGEPLYYLPNNAVVRFDNDKEIIYMPITYNKDNKSYLHKMFSVTMNQFVKSFNGEISSIVPILTSKMSLFDDSDNIVDVNQLSFNIFKDFFNYIGTYDGSGKDWLENNKNNILNYISSRRFVSWEKSQESIVARIPAQAMQSFMPMKNVAYHNSDSNDVYVSVWQIWLQGSDFDIDKGYILGYGFNKSAQYEDWSTISGYTTKEQLDILEQFPIPTGNSLEYSPTLTKDSLNATEFFNLIDPIENLDSNLLSVPTLTGIFHMLKQSKGFNKIFVEGGNEQRVREVINLLNKHNLDDSYLRKKNSIKNSVIAKVRKIVSAPSNQLLAEEPVEIQMHHDGAKEANKVYGYSAPASLSKFDIVSYFKQQEDAAVGKADVGVGANGQKVLFALNNYFNDFYNSTEFNYTVNLRTNPYSIYKEVYLGKHIKPNNGRDTFIINTISGTKFSKELEEKILNSYGYKEAKQQLDILESIASLNISGFISGATDNAKELVMAKINAIIDLARMHLYLMSLGFDPNQVAIYMNSPIAKYISDNIRTNSFFSDKLKKPGVVKLINEYKEIAKTLTNQEEVTEELKMVESFMDIYNGASEFSTLASVLKVNQRASANITELSDLFSKLELLMYRAENAVFESELINLRTFGEVANPIYQNLSKADKKVIEKIIEKNKNFETLKDKLDRILVKNDSKAVITLNKEQLEIRNYITNTLLEAKEFNIIGGQFDFRHYIKNDNEKYQNAAIKYYNLFKNTVNVFHVIKKSPHFKAMIDGVALTHEILNITSKKYNFVFSNFKDIVRENSGELVAKNNSNVEHILNNKAFPIAIEERQINRILVDFDKRMVAKWLKNGQLASNLNFNVGSLLKQAGIEKVMMYNSNFAKNYSIGKLNNNNLPENIAANITIVNSNDNFNIDLTTDFGIANFKILMEEVLFDLLLKSETSKLNKYLRLSTVKNPYNLFSNQIIPNFPINKLNSPVNAAKFKELIDAFTNVDLDIEKSLKIKNNRGKDIRWTDLFYVYNLIVNNEKYGDKRLTPLFENYAKDKNTYAYEYMDFSRKVDSGIVDIMDINDINQEKAIDEKVIKEYENTLINSILFAAYNKGNTLKTAKKGVEMSLQNANFPINTWIDLLSNKELEKYQQSSTIISLIKTNGLIINFKCT